MNQFKNGTVFVVVATFVTVVLLLLTGRNEKEFDESIVVDKQMTSEASVVAKNAIESETIDEKSDKPSKTLVESSEKDGRVVANQEKLAVKAPKDLFPQKAIETDQAKTEVANQDIPMQESLKSLDQPKWTQTLGEFVSLEDNEMIINVTPTNASGLQGDNPLEVVTTKNDKFFNGMPADYNYQEMPMYNGGYYVAPMPSYLMSSVLPKSSVSEK